MYVRFHWRLGYFRNILSIFYLLMQPKGPLSLFNPITFTINITIIIIFGRFFSSENWFR